MFCPKIVSMGEQAKLFGAEAVSVRDETFALPAYYAIRAALNTLHDAQDVRGTDEHWLWSSASSLTAKRLDLEALSRDIETGPSAKSLMTFERKDSRRIGKPALDFTLTRLVPDRFRAHRPEGGWGEELEVVVVRKDEIHARRDYLEERSAVSGLAVCKHALERYYERERYSHGVIHARILKDLADVDRRLAFATAAGLFCNGDSYSPDAVTVLPLGEGLLVVRNATILTEDGWSPSTRCIRKKRSFIATPTVRDPRRSLDSVLVEAKRAEGFLMAMGVTYLSSRILRLEQRAYAALFRCEAEKHDLNALGADMGRTWLAHEAIPEAPQIKVDPYLPYLLSQIANPGKRWPLWYAMGWTRSSDPRSE